MTKRTKFKKECMICGNDKKDEIELVPFFSDEHGNDENETNWQCKEDKGCNDE